LSVLLQVENLARHFGGGRSLLGRRQPLVKAVNDVSFTLERGRTLGIVGESGSGKSTLGRMIVGLLEPTAGTIRFEGENLADLTARGRAELHRRVQLVFQDPQSSLNPRKTLAQILGGPLDALLGLDRTARATRIEALMAMVALRPEFQDRYPHEFSGGQAQRIGIARALAAEPEMLVLDEPVSALDVSVQAQILNLLRRLRAELDLTMMFISHDLAVVEYLADEVAVMKDGEIVEHAAAGALFQSPRHAYTRQLMAAVPRLRPAS
jgi:ABC-type glutathione transport system ATPase component